MLTHFVLCTLFFDSNMFFIVFSCSAPVSVTCSVTSCSSVATTQHQRLHAVEVAAPTKSSAYKKKRVSVDIKLMRKDGAKSSKKKLQALAVCQVSPSVSLLVSERTLPAVSAEEVTFPLQQKPETSENRITKLKKKLKKKFFRSSSKDGNEMEARLPPMLPLAWQQHQSDASNQAASLEPAVKSAAGSGKEKQRRRSSQEQTRRKTVRHLRRMHSYSAGPDELSSWTHDRGDTDV